jgi:hypothetical protein
MSTASRRRRKPPPLQISPAALEDFIGTPLDHDRAASALDRATAAAEDFLQAPIPSYPSHPLRQGIFLHAAQLLMLPEDSPAAAQPSLLARAMWQAHASAPQG